MKAWLSLLAGRLDIDIAASLKNPATEYFNYVASYKLVATTNLLTLRIVVWCGISLCPQTPSYM